MKIRITTLTMLLLAATLTGCASWVAPLSDQPVDQFHGKRTHGARIEDQAIERKIYINAMRTLPATRNERLVAVSWNGQVLLTGQVTSDEHKQKLEALASSVRHVAHVHNELEIGNRIAWIARASDGWITTRVKARLLFGPDVPGRHVKVVTENGVVYLMGLLTREETEQAVTAVRGVYGVQKIVKIIEYIDPANARR